MFVHFLFFCFSDFPIVPVDPNMSAGDASILQQSFTALQQKFVQLFSEKVELLEKLQENEHLIIQLSHETETIGTVHVHVHS